MIEGAMRIGMRALEQLDDLQRASLLLGFSFAHLLFQSTCQHQRQHFPISHERPQRVSEGRGLVLLDEEVRGPRTAITRNQRQWKQPPPADSDQQDDEGDCCERAETMQHTSRWPAVLAQIIRPEIGEGTEGTFGHVKQHKLSVFAIADLVPFRELTVCVTRHSNLTMMSMDRQDQALCLAVPRVVSA